MLKTCALLLLAFAGSSDAVSTHTQIAVKKQLRVGVKHDVDDTEETADDDDTDGDDDAAEAAPAAVAPAEIKESEDEKAEMSAMMTEASAMFKEHGVTDVKTKHKADLARLMIMEEKLETKLDAVSGDKYKDRIAVDKKPVAEETTPGLANMLGSMREDMHEYVLPFYKDELEDKIEDLEKEQHQLVQSIATEENGSEKEDVKEEKEPEKKKEKEEIEEPAPAPVKRKPMGNNYVFLVATAIAVLAGVGAFFAFRKKEAAQ